MKRQNSSQVLSFHGYLDPVYVHANYDLIYLSFHVLWFMAVTVPQLPGEQ